MQYVNVFSDADLIPSKPKNLDCESRLQSKPLHNIAKTLQDQVKSKYDIIHSDVHGPVAIQSPHGKTYFVTLIDKFS
jgi:cellulose biosynthesis protein BcsQ